MDGSHCIRCGRKRSRQKAGHLFLVTGVYALIGRRLFFPTGRGSHRARVFKDGRVSGCLVVDLRERRIPEPATGLRRQRFAWPSSRDSEWRARARQSVEQLDRECRAPLLGHLLARSWLAGSSAPGIALLRLKRSSLPTGGRFQARVGVWVGPANCSGLAGSRKHASPGRRNRACRGGAAEAVRFGHQPTQSQHPAHTEAVSWLAAPSSAGAAHKRCLMNASPARCPLSAGRVVVLVARCWSHGSRCSHAALRGRRAGAARAVRSEWQTMGRGDLSSTHRAGAAIEERLFGAGTMSRRTAGRAVCWAGAGGEVGSQSRRARPSSGPLARRTDRLPLTASQHPASQRPCGPASPKHHIPSLCSSPAALDIYTASLRFFFLPSYPLRLLVDRSI